MSRSLFASVLCLALAPALVACGGDDDDDDDDSKDGGRDTMESPYCEESASPLAAGEAGPTGVSSDELLAAIPAELEGEVSFEDGVESGLSIVINVDAGSVRHVASEAVYPARGGTDIGIICDDRVEVDAVVDLLSEDGRLAESLELALYAPAWEEGAQPGTAEILVMGSAAMDPDGLEGSLDIHALHDTSDMDSVSMSMSLELVGAEAFGTIDGQGEGTDGRTAWAVSLPVASFEAAGERGPEPTR